MSRPLFNGITRVRVAAQLRRQGYGFLEARELSHSLTDDMIAGAVAQTEGAVSALGDGTIIKLILDFLTSPLGQQLIQLLISILLGG